MRPIPKNLLIHTVTLAKTEEEDRWGTESLEGMTELRYVRMEPSEKVIRDKNNAEVQLAATLFYDCRNSRPQGISFQTDDVIFFGEQKYSVQLAEPLYDGKKLHHYELGLVKKI